ncbi:hypothetical protein Daus18300_002988 [Diaporthe australafricana]|uniref:Ankyrin repeat protein n=1 Tax=Diaporthe australafricana TaxID=127596 RepID=A0ABR3XJV1_9PEZI
MADTIPKLEGTGNRSQDSSDLSRLDGLFEAIQSTHADRMKDILKDHLNILNMKNDPTRTKNAPSPRKLFDAGKLGNLMTQDVLMHSQVRRVTVDTYGMQRPLHVACLFGNIEAVSILLDQSDIDVNSKNGAEESPLGIACRAAHLEVAILLLEKCKGKIYVNQQDDVGNTPISYLAGQGIHPIWPKEPSLITLENLVKAMLNASRGKPSRTNYEDFSRLCMEEACRQGNIQLLRILINVAHDAIERQDKYGWTALHFAILSGEDEVVDILLEAGADPEPVAKDSDQMQPLELALAYGDTAIADKIRDKLWPKWLKELKEFMKKGPSSDADHLDHLKVQIWPGKIKKNEGTDASKGKSGLEVDSVPVRDILDKSKNEHLQVGSKQLMWCHFPANNLPLIDIDYLAGFQKGEDKQAKAGFSQLQKASPAIKRHISGMKNLYGGKNPALHHPRTLDHYYHTELDEARQNALNADQVLSRYLESRAQERTQQQKGDQTPRAPRHKFFMDWARHPFGSRRINPDTTVVAVKQTDIEYSGALKEDESFKKDDVMSTPSSVQDQEPQSILVVSQLWLIRLDNVLVTLFLQRWNQSKRNLDPLLTELKRLLQDTKRIDKGFNPNSKGIYHDMVRRSMQYRSLIEIGDKRPPLGYLSVFSKEVLRVSQEVDIQYDKFEKNMGTSDQVFRQLSEKIAKCLMNINDVLHEIEIIKQVLDHRASVWESMHQIPSRAQESLPGWKTLTPKVCVWHVKNCNPYEVRDFSYFDTDKLEKDAETV